jgi:hypothetical protein
VGGIPLADGPKDTSLQEAYDAASTCFVCGHAHGRACLLIVHPLFAHTAPTGLPTPSGRGGGCGKRIRVHYRQTVRSSVYGCTVGKQCERDIRVHCSRQTVRGAGVAGAGPGLRLRAGAGDIPVRREHGRGPQRRHRAGDIPGPPGHRLHGRGAAGHGCRGARAVPQTDEPPLLCPSNR